MATQWKKALSLANETRSARSELRAEMKGTERRRALEKVCVLIADPSPEMRSMKCVALLRLVPWIGRTRSEQILRRLGISPVKPLDALSDDEVTQITRALQAGVR